MFTISAPRTRTLLAAAAIATVSVAGLPLTAGTALASGGTRLTLTAPSSITYSHSAALSGRLSTAGGAHGISGRQVVLQQRPQGASTWKSVTSTRTSGTGSFRITVHPSRNMQYRTYFAAASGWQRSFSGSRLVGVKALVRTSLDRSRVPAKTLFRLRVTVSPARPGSLVTWQQLLDGRWVNGGRAKLDASSAASIGLIGTGSGTIKLRAVESASGRLLAGASKPVTIVITSASDRPAPPKPPTFPGGQPPAPGGSGH